MLWGTIPEKTSKFEVKDGTQVVIRDVMDIVPEKIPLYCCELYCHWEKCVPSETKACDICQDLKSVFGDPGRVFFQKWNMVAIFGEGCNIIVQGNG